MVQNPYAASARKYTNQDKKTVQQLKGLAAGPINALRSLVQPAGNAVEGVKNDLTTSQGVFRRAFGGTMPAAKTNTFAGPAGADKSAIATARQAGASLPSAGQAQAGPVDRLGNTSSLPAQNSPGAYSLRSALQKQPAKLGSVPNRDLGNGRMAAVYDIPQGGIQGPMISTELPSPGDYPRGSAKITPEGIAPPVAGTRQPRSEADIRGILTQGMDAARQQALDQVAARKEAAVNDLRSAVGGLATQAQGQMYDGSAAPRAAMPSRMSDVMDRVAAGQSGPSRAAQGRSLMTPGGMPDLPEGPSVRPVTQGQVNPPDMTNDRFTRTTLPDGTLQVVGRNRDGNQTIIPTGNQLGRRYVDSATGNTVSVSDRTAMENRLAQAAADGDAAAADRLARMDAYTERRDARRQQAQDIRTAAAGYQNYGQTGSAPVGLQGGAMGQVSPLYAATFGPNMSRSQALSLGRQDIQDPAGEDRAMRRAWAYATPADRLKADTANRALQQSESQFQQSMTLDRQKIESQDKHSARMADIAQAEADGKMSAIQADQARYEAQAQLQKDELQLERDRMEMEKDALKLGQTAAEQERQSEVARDLIGSGNPMAVQEGLSILRGMAGGQAGEVQAFPVQTAPESRSQILSEVQAYGTPLGQALGVDPSQLDAGGIADSFQDMVENNISFGPEDLRNALGYAQAQGQAEGDSFGDTSGEIWDAIRTGDPQKVAEAVARINDQVQRRRGQVVRGLRSTPY